MGMSKIAVLRDLLGDEARAQDANAAFEAAYARRVEAGEVEPLPGAEATLRQLREEGVRISLTTGFSAKTRELLLDALGWGLLANLALSPVGGLRGRPAPDLVLASLIRLQVSDVRAVAVVGDTVNDLVSGTRAGAGIVAGVLTGAHDRATLSSAPHTHVLDSIAELPDVLPRGGSASAQSALAAVQAAAAAWEGAGSSWSTRPRARR
jgi:phosphonatase-like hydrolase